MYKIIIQKVMILLMRSLVRSFYWNPSPSIVSTIIIREIYPWDLKLIDYQDFSLPLMRLSRWEWHLVFRFRFQSVHFETITDIVLLRFSAKIFFFNRMATFPFNDVAILVPFLKMVVDGKN